MDSVCVDSAGDDILRSCGRAVRNSRCKVDAFAAEVEIGLSTHHFGNIYGSLDDTRLGGGEMNISSSWMHSGRTPVMISLLR